MSPLPYTRRTHEALLLPVATHQFQLCFLLSSSSSSSIISSSSFFILLFHQCLLFLHRLLFFLPHPSSCILFLHRHLFLPFLLWYVLTCCMSTHRYQSIHTNPARSLGPTLFDWYETANITIDH